MSVALLAGGLAMLLGTLYGLAGCMLTGWRRRALEILNDALLGLPRLLLLLMVGLWIGTRGLTPAWAIGAVSWMTVARLVQSEGRALLSQGFFAAARGQGAGKPRLAVFHLLPNLAPVLSVQAALVAAEAVLLEATLSFLGVPGSSALSWGRIVADGQRLLPSGWWIVMFPGLLLFAVALGLQRAAGDAAPDSVTPPA
jgi:peptide/nickel transport system permease protein